MRYTLDTDNNSTCNWCDSASSPSAWKITDSGDWDDFACDWHARNLFASLFTLKARVIRFLAPRRGISA